MAKGSELPLLHEVAEAVGSLMEFWGFKRLMGRIWTLLYLRGEPLAAAELCEQLEISSGAASMTLSELERWGVVRRSRKPGDRREYFEAETDVWKMISRVLRERELSQIERALETFDHARDELEQMGGTRLGDIADRIERLGEMARMGRGLLQALVSQGRVDAGPLMRFARSRR
jgi:DNA-binding transcriptional regulator GbsR (MarR family)